MTHFLKICQKLNAIELPTTFVKKLTVAIQLDFK